MCHVSLIRIKHVGAIIAALALGPILLQWRSYQDILDNGRNTYARTSGAGGL